jgi:AcrR family transcriptional regulator
MRDLSRESGMSLAGMYHYVRGKEDLLYQIQQRCFTGVIAGAEQAVERHREPDGRLRAFVRHHLAYFAAQPAEMKVLSHEADSLTGRRADEILGLKRHYAAMLQGLVAAADGAHPSVGAYALFGMMNWTYTWYRPDGRLPPDALADVFADLFLHGVRHEAAPVTSQRPPGGRA